MKSCPGGHFEKAEKISQLDFLATAMVTKKPDIPMPVRTEVKTK